MPIRSKWESLPTEAINPASLALDKLATADIVDLMCAEDRKVLAAVQREKDRIALGAEMIAAALHRGGRIVPHSVNEMAHMIAQRAVGAVA